MKDFNLRQYLAENKLYTAEESKEEKTVINEGKKGKSNYMTELAEIDKQSALVALEAKINKLAEMAEAKANRLALVNEDENLSELISKQAVKEMHRSIKEIEKLKEKLLKEFTKKGGKMTEVIDEDEEMKEAQMIPDKNEDGTYDMSSVGMKEGEDSTYEEDDIEEGEEIDEASCGTYEEDGIEEDKVKGSNVRKDKSEGDWEVVSGKTGKPWPQDFKTKKSAQNAIKAYHASKG